MSQPTSSIPGPLNLLVAGATWRELLYLATTFPLGLAYFLLLTVGWAVGLATAIVWVGILLMFGVVALSSVLVRFERGRTRWLLGRDLGPWRREVPASESLTQTIAAHLGHRATWKGMLFLLVTFPLGLLTFCLLVTSIALSLGLLLAPLAAMGFAHGDIDGLIILPTPAGAAMAFLAGVLLSFATLYLVRGLAAIFRALAIVLLSGRELTPAVDATASTAVELAAAA